MAGAVTVVVLPGGVVPEGVAPEDDEPPQPVTRIAQNELNVSVRYAPHRF